MSDTAEPTGESRDTSKMSGAIQQILDEGQKVRDRIRDVVTGSVKDQEFSIAKLGKAASQVMQAAYKKLGAATEHAVPRDSEGALRDVVYGIGDAFGSAARSAGGALEAATRHGKAFAAEDIKKVTLELGKLGSTLVSSVADAGQSAAGHAAGFANSAAGHATKAAEEIKPTVEGALAAAAQHPVEVTVDATKAGVDMTRQVAGSLFSVLGDFMHKAAEVIGDAGKAAAPPAKDDAPAPKD